MSASGNLERQLTTPEKDLEAINTNTLIKDLVEKYWSEDLNVIEIRNRANKHFSKGQLQDAKALYDKAFNLCSDDHLVLSNRSITNLKSGDTAAALEDANMAVALRPDWAKAQQPRPNGTKA